MRKVLLLLIVALLSFGCTNPYQSSQEPLVEQPKKQVKELKTLRIHLTDNVYTLDPAFVQTAEERQISVLLFNGLVQLDRDTLLPIKALAQSWNVSEDGKIYTFKLFPNLKFQNGRPITASDVKFSWERAIYVNSPEKYIFSNIVGYWEFVTGRANAISGIQLIGEDKLQVQLAAANNGFLLSLTQPAAAVVDRYQIIKQANSFAKQGNPAAPPEPPNGTGPYKLYDWYNDKIVLGDNSKYHINKPNFQRIEVSLENRKEMYINDYILGELDAVHNLTQSEIATIPGLKGNLKTTTLSGISYLRFNPAPTNRALSDMRVRKALMLAVEFKRIGAYLNTEEIHYLPGGITSYLENGLVTSEQSVAYKTYNAKQLLNEAGFPGGKGLEFNLYYVSSQPELQQAAQLLKAQWSARGVRVHPMAVTLQELNALKANKTAQVYLEKWSAPYPALEAFYYPEFHTAFGSGYTAELDALIADALFTVEKSQQVQKFTAIEKYLQQQYLLQPLFAYSAVFYTKPYLTGLVENKLGLLSIEKAERKKD